MNDAEAAAAQELVEEVIGEMNIGDLVRGEMSETDSSEEETSSSSEGESSTSENPSRRSDRLGRPTPIPPNPSIPAQASSSGGLEVPILPTPSIASGSTKPQSLRPKKTLERLRTGGVSGTSTPRRTPESGRSSRRKQPAAPPLKEPELKRIAELLPPFLEMIRPRLTSESTNGPMP